MSKKRVSLAEAVVAMQAGEKVYKTTYTEVSTMTSIKYLFGYELFVDVPEQTAQKEDVPELKLAVKAEPEETADNIIKPLMPLETGKTYQMDDVTDISEMKVTVVPDGETGLGFGFNAEPISENSNQTFNRDKKRKTIDQGEVKRLYNRGFDAKEIAKKMGFSYAAIWRVIDNMKNEGELV